MNRQFQEWLTQKPPLAGVLAWGIRMADKSSVTQSFSEAFTEMAIENAWRCVADTLQVIRLNRFPEQRLRWVYEHGWLLCVARSEGCFLGILTTNQKDQVDWTGLENMMTEFQSLTIARGSAAPIDS